VSDLEQKPFDIPKRLVWEAYRKVAANKGAAGVDGQSITEFEEDLKGNLYKLWNRRVRVTSSTRRGGAG
jgi:retron-type reverse transcriptase